MAPRRWKCAGSRAAHADDWPCWRGPERDGISRETNLLREWPAGGPRRLWKADLAGGFSSIAAAGGKAIAHTKGNKQETVICFDAASGKELWRYAYDCNYGTHPELKGGVPPKLWLSGPRATPAIDGGRVYTLGTTGILLCLDLESGTKVWEQDLLKLSGRDKCPRQGYCASPLIVGDRLYLHPAGPNGKSIAALDKSDGKVIWQALDDPPGHGTPVWARINGVTQLVFFTSAGAVGADPNDGRALWRYPWTTQYDLNVATPIVDQDRVFISSNYGSGAALFRIPPKGEPETIWRSKAMQCHFATPVLSEGHLYGFSEARLRCVEFGTGTIKWDKPGLGKGSLVLGDGRLIVLGEHGELVLAKAAPTKYEEVSRCQLFDKGALTWTVPALADGRLFIRTEYALLALDVSAHER
jgi:outer membrane protein assembly factor BamB